MTLDVAEPATPAEVAGTTRINGAAVRRLRERRGLNATQFAAILGIKRQYLSKLENGDRAGTPETRLLLARHLGVDLSDITYTVPRVRRRPRQSA